MADKPVPPATPAAEPPKKRPRRAGLLNKLAIAGFMGVVVLSECLLAYFLVPGPEEIAARTQGAQDDQPPAAAAADQAGTEAEEALDVVEVDLGDYHISAPQSASNTTLRVDFHLYGTVRQENLGGFEKLHARLQRRFSEQVIVEIRHAELTDLNDPGLGLIKRRFLEKSNKLFGKAILLSVGVDQFSIMEQ